MSTILVPEDKNRFVELLLRCECHTLSHLISIGYFAGDVKPQLFIDVCSNVYVPFWRRLLSAVRYVFGYTYKGGGEVVLSQKDAKDLKKFLVRFLREK